MSTIGTLQVAVGRFDVGHRYTIVPGFAATVTKAQAQALARAADRSSRSRKTRSCTATNASAQASFGVTKARIDAGAHGDGDGNPNVYSKDDFVAAVIDTGIDASHQDLDGGKVIGWNDFVNGQPSPYDDNGHGTHVAGDDRRLRRRASGPPVPRRRVRWRARRPQGARTATGSGLMSNVIAAINWVVTNKATYGIEAINLSLGPTGCSNGGDATSLAVNAAFNAGIVVAVAAGNAGPRHLHDRLAGRRRRTR